MVQTMEHLVELFNGADILGARYIAVEVEMKGFNKPEAIINHRKNFKAKRDYYMNTYDENLNHKYAEGIKIINAAFGDTYEEIRENLAEDDIWK